MKRLYVLVAIFLSWEAAHAFTGQITENFTTTTYEDTVHTTAVWNIYLGMIHPPLVASANSTDYPIDVGDGSDGSFDPTTYANFSVGGVTTGDVITIDTGVHPVLNFTKFLLAPGYTINGTGPNPLIIHVLGPFTNLGDIDCSGGDGQNVTSDITTAPAGGTSRCGGGVGGNGGASGISPTAGGGGVGGGVNDTPGQPSTGNTNATGIFPTGGGGGGGYGPNATANSGGGGGGAAGACTNTPFVGSNDDWPGGGSGGGGGGAYLASDSNQSSGGGGGGGGGVIIITAVGDVDNEGTIFANGGNGGSAVAGLGGSGGGGGGGGTIVIQTVSPNFVDNGAVTANYGAFGVAGSGNAGGDGCEGRGWIVGSNGFSSGTGLESPGFGAPLPGQILYSVAAVTAQSLSYDSLNTSPTYVSATLTKVLPNASTAQISVAGSDDDFITDNTGFVPVSSALSSINGKRYFKFQIQLQLDPGGGAATTPATVSLMTANLNGMKQTDFQFNTTCGTFGGPGEFLLFLFLCYGLGTITTGRLRKGMLFRRPTN